MLQILKDEEDIDAKVIEPKDGEFNYDFGDEGGSVTDQEIIWEFKGNKGEDYSLMLQYDFGWEVNIAKYRGTWEQPPDPDEVVMNWLEIHPTAFFYDDDNGEENEFTINEENKKLMQNFLEREIDGIDSIKIK